MTVLILILAFTRVDTCSIRLLRRPGRVISLPKPRHGCKLAQLLQNTSLLIDLFQV